MKLRNAFTMTELIFVIVVIGILAAVAIPKVGSSVIQAQISSGKADIMALRSSILNERQKRLMRGDNTFITKLSSGTMAEGQPLFDGDGTNKLFTYAKISKNASGKWMRSGDKTYTYIVDSTTINFTYNTASGTFTCNRAASGKEGQYCIALTE
jgi:general secretion pathway protein G